MKIKRVEFKFYLDIEGTDKEIKEVISDTVTRTLFEFQDYEPYIEPYQWIDLGDETSKYSPCGFHFRRHNSTYN